MIYQSDSPTPHPPWSPTASYSCAYHAASTSSKPECFAFCARPYPHEIFSQKSTMVLPSCSSSLDPNPRLYSFKNVIEDSLHTYLICTHVRVSLRDSSVLVFYDYQVSSRVVSDQIFSLCSFPQSLHSESSPPILAVSYYSSNCYSYLIISHLLLE